MGVVANVGINFDARNAIQNADALRRAIDRVGQAAKGAQASAKGTNSAWAKASTVQAVFAAKVANTEGAIRSQIAALQAVQQKVKLGGALYQKAQKQIDAYQKTLREARTAGQAAKTGLDAAGTGAKGLGAAIQSALGPILTITTAVATLKKGLDVAFTRGAAEQKLRNFTSSTEEFNAAMAVAANSSAKFGISQTEATVAIADTLSRLKGLGFGLKETSQIYDGFNAIAMESGTSAEDAAGAFVQLSQALGSGKLQGDELRSILERMPNLAQKIATSMGRSAAEVRSLGQEGALTSEVIYKALSEAAEASDNFGDKLNEQQKAQKGLAQVSDRLFNSIGQAFGPIILKSIEAITWASNEIGDWWDYLGGVILPKLTEAVKPLTDALKQAFSQVDIKALVVVIQGTFIKSLEFSIAVIGKMSEVLGFVVNKLREMADNPVFRFIADNVGRLLNHLGLTTDKVGEFATKQKEVTAEAAKTVDQFSAMPDKIENAKEAQKRLREEAKALKEAQRAVTDEIKKQTSEIQRQFSASSDLLSLQGDLKQEQIKSQLELNSLIQEQLKYNLDNAKTDEERIYLSKLLRKLQQQAAKLEYESALATIKLQLRKVELAYEEVKAKEKAVRTEVARAKAAGIANEHHEESLRLVQEEVAFSSSLLLTSRKIAKEQAQQAQYALKSKNLAAELAYQQNLVAKNTGNAADEAARYAQNMQKGANASATGKLGEVTTKTITTAGPIDPDIMAKVQSKAGGWRSPEAMVSEMNKLQNERNKRNANLARIQKIEEARAQAARNNPTPSASTYLNGAYRSGIDSRYAGGSTAGTINIQTGPVMQQNGQNYVSMADMEKALAEVSRARENASRSYGGRRYVGVS